MEYVDQILEDIRSIDDDVFARGIIWYGVTFSLITYGIGYFLIAALPIHGSLPVFAIGVLIGLVILAASTAGIGFLKSGESEYEELSKEYGIDNNNIPVVPRNIKFILYSGNLVIFGIIAILSILLF